MMRLKLIHFVLVRKTDMVIVRSSRPEVFCKKVFLEILKNSQEDTCGRVSFLIKLQTSGL